MSPSIQQTQMLSINGISSLHHKAGNGYPLPCYYPGWKIVNGTRENAVGNAYIPALHSWACWGVMQRKLREQEQANQVRDERQPRQKSLTLELLWGRPRTAHFSALPLRPHSHDPIPSETECMLNG